MNDSARLAQIESTYLGVEDHGIFTSYLHVKYEGASSQGIGGYSLDGPKHDEDGKFLCRVGSAAGADFILRTLTTLGVGSWEKLPGVYLYVLTENESWNSRVVGICNVAIGAEQRKFIFADCFETANA